MSNREIYINSSGGLGRVIASTGAINEYAKNSKVKVNVVSSFPQVFNGLENINRVYNIGMPYLYEDYISKGEFMEPEPYNNSAYYADYEHLATTFNYLLTGKREFIQPKVELTQNELDEAKAFVDDMRKQENKKILLVQPWGSTGGIQIADENGQPKTKVDETYRSFGLGFYKKLIEKLGDDYVIVSVQSTAHHNNQQVPQVAIKGTKVISMPDARKIIALIPYVDGVIACDSFLHHASAALNTPVKTIVLWGATSPKNLGYKEHFNLIARDNVLIEPNRVPHDHEYYVNKNKGVNEFPIEWIDKIKEYLETPIDNNDIDNNGVVMSDDSNKTTEDTTE